MTSKRKICKIIVFFVLFLILTLPLATALSLSEVSIRGQQQINGLLEDNDFALFTVEVSDPIEAQYLTVEVFDKQYFFDSCLGTTCILKLPKKTRNGGSYAYTVKLTNKEGIVDTYQAKLIVDEQEPEITSYLYTKKGDSVSIDYGIKDSACESCTACSGLGKITFSVKGEQVHEVPLGILDCSKKDTITLSLSQLGVSEDSKLCMEVYDNVGKVSDQKCSEVYVDTATPAVSDQGMKLMYKGKELHALSSAAMEVQLVAVIVDDQLVPDSVIADVSSLNPLKSKEYKEYHGKCTKTDNGYECVWDVVILGSNAGQKNVVVAAKDMAGNELSYTHTFDLVVDTMPPKVIALLNSVSTTEKENEIVEELFKEQELEKVYFKDGKNTVVILLEEQAGLYNKQVYLDTSSLGGSKQQVEKCSKLEGNQWECEATVQVSGNKKGVIAVASSTKDDLGNSLSQQYTREAVVDNKIPSLFSVKKSDECPTQQEGLTLTVEVNDDNPVAYTLETSSVSSQPQVMGACDFQEIEAADGSVQGKNTCTITLPDLFSYPVKTNLALTIYDPAGNKVEKSVPVSICESDQTTQPNFVTVKPGTGSKIDRRTLSFVEVPTKVSLTISTSGGVAIIDKQLSCDGSSEAGFLDTTTSENIALITLSQQSLDKKSPEVKGDTLEITCKLSSKLRRGNKLLTNVEEDEFKIKIPLFNQPLGTIDKAIQDKIDETQKRIDELQGYLDSWGTFNTIFDGWSKGAEAIGTANEAWQLGKATYYAFSCPAEQTAKTACNKFALETAACAAALSAKECTVEVAASMGIGLLECPKRIAALNTEIGTEVGIITQQFILSFGPTPHDPKLAANAAAAAQTALSGLGVLAQSCHVPASMMTTACNAWATNDEAWKTQCAVASKEHNFVDEYIWPMGLYGGNPIGTINKAAIMIFNKCALTDFNTYYELGMNAWFSDIATDVQSGTTVAGEPRSVPSKVSFKKQYGVTTSSGLGYQGQNFWIDPFKNKDVALYTGCLPAIIFNHEKEKNIQCLKKTCLENQAKQGLPTDTCEHVFDLRMCTYVYPPIRPQLDFLGNILKSLPYVVAGGVWKASCGEYIYAAYECQVPGVCPDSHNSWCGVSGLSVMIPELLSLIDKLWQLKNIASDLTGTDYCK